MKMKKGILVFVLFLLLMTMVYGEEDVPIPPGNIAPGCPTSFLPCTGGGGEFQSDIVAPTVAVQLVSSNQIVRADVSDDVGVREVKFFYKQNLPEGTYNLQERREVLPSLKSVSQDFDLSAYTIVLQDGDMLRVDAVDSANAGTA